HIIIKRVTGEIETNRIELLSETFHRQPGLARRQRDILLTREGLAKKIMLASFGFCRRAIRHSEDGIDTFQHLCSVSIEIVESTGFHETLKRPAVQYMSIDPAGEIAERDERPFASPLLDQMLDGTRTHVLEGRKRIENRAIPDREVDLRGIDRRRHNP